MMQVQIFAEYHCIGNLGGCAPYSISLWTCGITTFAERQIEAREFFIKQREVKAVLLIVVFFPKKLDLCMFSAA